MLGNTVLMALREIRRNTLRSTLTTLGIVIGVGAVIALVTLGQGATDRVTSDISNMGVNMIIVSPGAWRRRGPASGAQPLTMDDAHAIEREIPSVMASAPSAQRAQLVVYGSLNWNTVAVGVTDPYFTVRNLERSISSMSRCVSRRLVYARPKDGDTVCRAWAAVRSHRAGSRTN